MDAKMVDMGMTKDELKAEKKEMAVGYDGKPNPYPWGLNIRLEDRELGKLGMKDMPMVGAEIHFMAVGKVTSVSQSASEGRDEQRCVAMQITGMHIMAAEPAEKE